MIYVVLGMHKSGTTLVSQMLHHSGINMGDFDDEVSYDGGNKYERQSSFELDKAILGTPDDEVLYLKRPQALELTADHRKQMQNIVAGCRNRYQDWGFKDPRATLIYDLWASELPSHKIIAVFRPPDQIWPRFKWQGKRKYHTNFHRAYAYLSRWQEHNLAMVAALRRTEMEYVVLDYRELMAGDAEFLRLNNFVGGRLQDRRVPGLYRARSGSDIFFSTAERLMQWREGLSVGQTLAELDSVR